MQKIGWSATSDPAIFTVAWSSDSLFQIGKEDVDLLTELRDHGMEQIVGVASVESAAFPIGVSFRFDSEGVPFALADKPEIASETQAREAELVQSEMREASRRRAITSIRTERDSSPINVIFYDLAVAIGLIDP